MAIMRVAGQALEHVLDLPEGVRITNIERAYGVPEDAPTVFIFYVEGEDPESGEVMEGEVTATYSQDETGVHFVGFDRVD